MKHLIPYFLILIPAFSFSQVEIIKDPRLDLLIQKQEELNRRAYLENSRMIPGFRISVINTNDRIKAMDIKSRLMKEFPEHKTYFIYQSPVFKVQIGNFKTRLEAEAVSKQIQKYYPIGVIVIPSPIEVKQEDIQNIK